MYFLDWVSASSSKKSHAIAILMVILQFIIDAVYKGVCYLLSEPLFVVAAFLSFRLAVNVPSTTFAFIILYKRSLGYGPFQIDLNEHVFQLSQSLFNLLRICR